MTVVGRSLRCTTIKERSTKELVLNFAGQSACRFALNLKLFIGIIMKTSVLSDFVIGYSDSRNLEDPLRLASFFSLQAKIFEVIDTLCIDELNVLSGGSSIGVTEMTLKSNVVVFERSTGKSVLVQTGSEAGFLRRCINQRVIQSTNHFVWNTFEGPWSETYVFCN